MIPVVNDDLVNDFTEITYPTKTYKLDMANQFIAGTVDGLDALKQSIYFILNTERYDYLIYSWNYGVELQDLIGRELEFVLPELERRITEALIQDTRIISVNGFDFNTNDRKVTVKFTVNTMFGDIQTEKVVNI
jgi:phage baseplate assembly protein W